MQGYIIQVENNNFINWQGLKVDQQQYAIVFPTQAEAETVAQIHPDAQVLPYETDASNKNNIVSHGSFHEWHSKLL